MPLYRIIGLMSGSSLDGLDIAYCLFKKDGKDWNFSIEKAECISYPPSWEERLRTSRQLNGKDLWKLHSDYGHFLSDVVNDFISKNELVDKVDLIASHGHTVFHFPADHFTTQIGDGAALASGTHLPVACDFRTSDIALGGQGTPIVAIGDLLLFKDYKYLLNLGGIANLTIKIDNTILAFDVCAVNQVLNHYAYIRGWEYDQEGQLAKSGQLSQPLLNALNSLSYYKNLPPKSLDNGFSHEIIIPLIDSFSINMEDKLCSYCEHIAIQITNYIEKIEPSRLRSLFITGGGAFNTYLVDRIRSHSSLPIHIPASNIVKYKEALAIAFIGLLRTRNEINVLRSVTGSSRSTVGGALYHP